MSDEERQRWDQEALLWRLLYERVDEAAMMLAGVTTVLEALGRDRAAQAHLHARALDAHTSVSALRSALRAATPEQVCRSCGGVFRPTRLLWTYCGVCVAEQRADDDLDGGGGVTDVSGTEEGAREPILPQLELVERLGVVLRLLRDAGAEDVAARMSVEAGEAIYHGLVHSMQDAAARWRAEQGQAEGGEGGARE